MNGPMTVPNLFLATTGTSLRGNLQKVDRGDPGADWVPQDLAKDVLECVPPPWRPEGEERADCSHGGAVLEQVVAAMGGRPLPPLAVLGGLAAEVQSLVAEGAPEIRAEDRVVLVASDTRAGLEMAAAVSTFIGGPVRIGSAGPQSIDWCHEGCGGRGEEGGQQVDVVWIKDLATPRPETFNLGSRGLGRLLAWAYEQVAPEGRLVVHATGGYKVTIPYLMALASHLPFHGAAVEAWANHDARPVGIQLPLQRIGPDRELRLHLERVAAGLDPPDTRWEQYAYAYEPPDGWRITPLGEGLAAMFEHLPLSPP